MMHHSNVRMECSLSQTQRIYSVPECIDSLYIGLLDVLYMDVYTRLLNHTACIQSPITRHMTDLVHAASRLGAFNSVG